MDEQDNFERLRIQYPNACADVILGKNLEAHYVDVLHLIKVCNDRVDNALLSGNISEAQTFKNLCYEYYRFKDDIIQAIGNRQ